MPNTASKVESRSKSVGRQKYGTDSSYDSGRRRTTARLYCLDALCDVRISSIIAEKAAACAAIA